MDYRRLMTFRTAAVLLSFSRAAETLHCTQSTVSAQIKTLEQEMGAPLFNRLGKRIALTSEGETLLRYASRILDLHEEARARMRGQPEPACALSLRMPQSLADRFLPLALQVHARTHPRTDFDIGVCAFSALEAELRAGITDAAFLLADSVRKPALSVERIGTAPLVFVAGARKDPAPGKAFAWDDLTQTRLFVPKHDCSYKMVLEQELAQRRITPPGLVACNSLGMLRKCLALGLGVALLPEFAVEDDLRAGTLRRLDWAGPKLVSGILRIMHKNKWVSPQLACFLDAFSAVLPDFAGS
ncbi:LysR family transcriptional regulator [Desulfovibrio aminophilus]|nr:LysR family transcriptional regulator [Desulfovibrio aminophilus]MCM0755489.1 LysR family transcriptional regulator [Desulfovibrio aminophilus]